VCDEAKTSVASLMAAGVRETAEVEMREAAGPEGQRGASRVEPGPLHAWECRKALTLLENRTYELEEGGSP
jgi:hypothetical protein